MSDADLRPDEPRITSVMGCARDTIRPNKIDQCGFAFLRGTLEHTDKTGRMAPCPNRRPGPLHVENGEVRYTTSSSYKLRGTVSQQGQLAMGLVAPGNAGNAGAQSLNLNTNGQIDNTGTVRVRQIGASCSYDFAWQKQS